MNTPTKEKIIELALKAGFENWSFGLVIHDAYGNGVLVEDQLIEFARLVLAEVAPTPDADGWVAWTGGKCPVPEGSVVEVRFRNWSCFTDRGNSFGWGHDDDPSDIVAYRVIEGGAAPKPDADGWIEWTGAVSTHTMVEVRFRNGSFDSGMARHFYWGHKDWPSDIVAYRVIEGGAA